MSRRGVPLPRSLAGRLALAAAAAILLALALTGWAAEVALARFVGAGLDGRIDGQILGVADALRPAPGGGLALARPVDGPPYDRPGAGWYWEVLGGTPGADPRDPAQPCGGTRPDRVDDGSPRPCPGPEPLLRSPSLGPGGVAVGEVGPPGPRGGPRPGAGEGPGGEALRLRLDDVLVAGRPVTVLATAPLAALRGPLRDALLPLALILALLGLALLGGVVLQVRLGLRPLRRLRQDLARVRAGRAARIPGDQPAEVAPLVAELNLLLDENAANLERARRNVANLAHGLKTPLATLGLSLDGPAGAELRPLVERMDRLIRHHLARARAAALGGAARGRVDLAGAAADHLAVFGKLHADRGLALAPAVPAGLAVAVEAQDFDEVLGNLLDNAGKWARSRVVLSAAARGARVALAVEDDGPGLSEAETALALRPGGRADESAPGHGFGLPIARELVELYGGSVALTRSALGGLRVSFDLPRAE